MDKEFGLVLAGGGTKGAYEVGVWKALKELNINITAIAGTSIGALNAALILQDDFEKIFYVWKQKQGNTKNPRRSVKICRDSIYLIYFSTRRDSPVISFGCSMPISWIRVGMMSARHPFSRSVYFGSAFTRINGTGFVVCAVHGSPVS